uniref:Uncharacterized protein n=1 Tax=Callorhinchus milii TaxID=7868 RepID=A0A4W3K8S2_CALMI
MGIGLLCPINYFKCRNMLCIPKIWLCDGLDDCGDWSDEHNCGCFDGSFKCLDSYCLPSSLRCDGNNDCSGGLDEKNCGNTGKWNILKAFSD